MIPLLFHIEPVFDINHKTGTVVVHYDYKSCDSNSCTQKHYINPIEAGQIAELFNKAYDNLVLPLINSDSNKLSLEEAEFRKKTLRELYKEDSFKSFSTYANYVKYGEWIPKRVHFHNEIKLSLFRNANRARKAIITIGTLSDYNYLKLQNSGVNLEDYVNLHPAHLDNIIVLETFRTGLPIVGFSFVESIPLVEKEREYLVNKFADEAIIKGDNLILELSLDNLEEELNIIERMRNAGYHIEVKVEMLEYKLANEAETHIYMESFNRLEREKIGLGRIERKLSPETIQKKKENLVKIENFLSIKRNIV